MTLTLAVAALPIVALVVAVGIAVVEFAGRWFRRPRGNAAARRLTQYAAAQTRRRWRRMHRA